MGALDGFGMAEHAGEVVVGAVEFEGLLLGPQAPITVHASAGLSTTRAVSWKGRP